MHSGELSREQHQQLLKQLNELYQFQKMRVNEAWGEVERGKAAEDRPVDPRFLAMVNEMEGSRRKSDSDDRALFPPRDVDMRMMDPSRPAIVTSDSDTSGGELFPVLDRDERKKPAEDVDLRRPEKPAAPLGGNSDVRLTGDRDDREPLALSSDKDERRILIGPDTDDRRIPTDRDDRRPPLVGADKDDRPPLMALDTDERRRGPPLLPAPPGRRLPDEPARPRGAILLTEPPRSESGPPPLRMNPDAPPHRSRPGFPPEDMHRGPPPPDPRETGKLRGVLKKGGRGGEERPPPLKREEPINLRPRPPRHEFDQRRSASDGPPQLRREFPDPNQPPDGRPGPPRDSRERPDPRDPRDRPGPPRDHPGPPRDPRDRPGPPRDHPGPPPDHPGPPNDRPGPPRQMDDRRGERFHGRRGGPGQDFPERDERHFPGDDPRHMRQPRGDDRRDFPPFYDHPDDFDDRRHGRFNQGRGGRGDRRPDRGPSRDDRRHPRDERGPPRDDRGRPIDERGPPRGHR